ncbi:MAG: hypothetical protein GF398_19090 [Chitinivibrionales bacterium]|nr:hypothetical protein [Chitinivibrionales bacterium]
MTHEHEPFPLLALKSETADVKTLIFRGCGSKREFLDRKPGQYVEVSLQQDGTWSEPHPFTVANAPGSDIIWLTVKRRGLFTNRLHALQPGQRALITGPFGAFCSRLEQHTSIIMIAAGTGIAPFLSVLRHYQRAESALPPITLFWWNESPEDFFYLHLLDSFYFSMDFSAVVISQHPFSGKHLKHHRLSTIHFVHGELRAELIKKYTPLADAAMYVCGLKDSLTPLDEQLQELGVAPHAVHREFWTHPL